MRNPSSTKNNDRWDGIGAVIVALAIAAVAYAAIQPRVFGQFHDDGLYLTTAQSLADGHGYRHASLPTNPPQTKYPPLYSAVLAVASGLAPATLADGTRWFKAIGALCLAVVVVLSWVFGRQRLRGRVPPLILAALVGISPLVFPWVDYTMTELPFLALCLAAFCLAPRRERGTTNELGGAIALGVVCGLALLVRQAGLPLVLAGVVAYGIRREWRPFVAFILPVLLLIGPWFWFKATQTPPTSNPLLAYYTGYEPSVVELGLNDPALALQIVLANLYYLWATLDLAAYTTYLTPARVLLYPALLIGLWRIFKEPFDFVSVFSIAYAGLIVLWPWNPARYAIPLAPLLPLAVLFGGQFLATKLAASEASGAPTGARLLRRTLPWLPASIMLFLAVRWVLAYTPHVEGTTRMAFLSRLDYDWAGFEDTADWIRENTPADAILATAYDPMYYLSTGRRGVRPWFHRPWTYSYPIGAPEPDIGSAAAVQAALQDLGADFLVIDPLDGYLERDAAQRLFEALLERYRAVGTGEGPQLRFVSRDSLHRVYELPQGTRRN